VLVQGATGFAGRLAVQIARKLGAGRVVASGRDPASLCALPGLGADAVIDLAQPDDAVAAAFAREAGNGYDVVVDYLWGRPTELLLRGLVPTSFAPPRKLTRIVHVGAAAGDAIALRGEMVRTSGVSILGVGGRMDRAKLAECTATVFEWLRAGVLRAEVERVPLREIASAWPRVVHGSRLVVVP
jgi:NADPH2:quinone reductase